MDSEKNTQREIEETFEELFDKIFRYLRIRIPTNEDAEDLAAEIFAKAWKRARSYEAEQGTVLMWLFGIARHEIATYWKHHSVKQVDYDAVATILHDEGQGAARHNTALDLDRLLQGLPDEQRALVVRHYIDGVSHTDLARGVGRSVSAVRQTVSRAIRNLKDKIISP